jgi:hypothetical protein
MGTVTPGCISGEISQAYYGQVPAEIVRQDRNRLPESFLAIVEEFDQKFGL